jgi:hypothetical protein
MNIINFLLTEREVSAYNRNIGRRSFLYGPRARRARSVHSLFYIIMYRHLYLKETRNA